MKSALRALFGGLLALAIATQAVRIANGPSPPDDAGWTRALGRLGPHVADDAGSRTLAVTLPQCTGKLTLARIGFDGANDETVRALLATAVVPRYVYLGYVGDRIDPAAIGARWAAASVLAAVGLRRGAAPRDVVVVLVPEPCTQLLGRDWSVLSPWS